MEEFLSFGLGQYWHRHVTDGIFDSMGQCNVHCFRTAESRRKQ